MQLDEQNRLVDQLKQSLNGSKNEFEKKLIEQKLKSNDCQARIEQLEKEIVFYKETLLHLKNKSPSTQQLSQHELNEASISSSQFKANNMNISREIMNGIAKNDSSANAKLVKVSRKDLRVLTDDELLKRSLKKDVNDI